MKNRLRIGRLTLDRFPGVVGTVSTAALLRRVARPGALPCDVVEVRLDALGGAPDRWWPLAAAAGRAGRTLLLTIRSGAEGGAWRGAEKERAALYFSGLDHAHAVDVEIRSAIFRPVAGAARAAGRFVIGSFHDFERTPPARTLLRVIDRGRAGGAHLVKLATMIRRPADVAELFDVLRDAADMPLCVLGMGPLGRHSRTSLVCAGSRLTYGYLDRPAAPGQLSCKALRRRLSEDFPGFAP